MMDFPPGFPFVSRRPDPEPAPEPEPAAAEPQLSVPESASETLPAETIEPEPQRAETAAAHVPWWRARREEAPAATAVAPQPSENLVRAQAAVSAPAPAPVPAVTESVPATACTSAINPAPAAPPPVSHDRRKNKRDSLATPALLRIDGIHGPPLKIELSDISIAGARFRAPHRIDVGEKAQIRVEAGPFRWTTRLRVVHCSPSEAGGATTIGCAFLRTELLRPWPVAA